MIQAEVGDADPIVCSPKGRQFVPDHETIVLFPCLAIPPAFVPSRCYQKCQHLGDVREHQGSRGHPDATNVEALLVQVILVQEIVVLKDRSNWLDCS